MILPNKGNPAVAEGPSGLHYWALTSVSEPAELCAEHAAGPQRTFG